MSRISSKSFSEKPKHKFILRPFSLICLFFITALSACTTMQAYQGDRLPRNEVAQVKGVDEYFIFGFKIVRIDTIDDMKTTGRGHSVEMLPGLHTLGITYASGLLVSTYTGKRACYITLDAKAGASYIIDGDIDNGLWHAWLQNTANDEKINCQFNRPKA